MTIELGIPPFQVRTIECDMDLEMMCITAQGLKTVGSTEFKTSEEVDGKFDIAIYRRLRHSAFSYGLEDLYSATRAPRREPSAIVDQVVFTEGKRLPSSMPTLPHNFLPNGFRAWLGSGWRS